MRPASRLRAAAVIASCPVRIASLSPSHISWVTSPPSEGLAEHPHSSLPGPGRARLGQACCPACSGVTAPSQRPRWRCPPSRPHNRGTSFSWIPAAAKGRATGDVRPETACPRQVGRSESPSLHPDSDSECRDCPGQAKASQSTKQAHVNVKSPTAPVTAEHALLYLSRPHPQGRQEAGLASPGKGCMQPLKPLAQPSRARATASDGVRICTAPEDQESEGKTGRAETRQSRRPHHHTHGSPQGGCGQLALGPGGERLSECPRVTKGPSLSRGYKVSLRCSHTYGNCHLRRC